MKFNKIDIQEVIQFIKTQGNKSKIYIGADSEKVCVDRTWFIDYTLAIVVHIDGNKGCKVFGEVHRESDISYDRKSKPRLRLMTEVYKLAELYMQLGDILEEHDVEVHLDINPNFNYGSSCVINEAIGYIKGVCNVTPMVKPNAWAASTCADRLKTILNSNKLLAVSN